MVILSCSTEPIIAPNQVGWTTFMEGRAIIAAKIIRSKASGSLFAAIPTAYKSGVLVPVVTYPDPKTWYAISQQLVVAFEHFVSESQT